MSKKKARPRLSEEEMSVVNEFRAIQKAAKNADLDPRTVKHGWMKDGKSSLFFKNPDFEIEPFDPDSIDWSFLKKITPTVPKTQKKSGLNGIFDRLVYTDTHVGMNPNPNGYSLYGGKWDEFELNERLDKIVETVIENQSSNFLIVDDLGDFMDGWDGKTVRREHDLPQNMDNAKGFDVGLSFKWKLFVSLAKHYEKILFNNICEDNHSGSFGYVVNSAFKKMVDFAGNKNYEVVNHRKFINHYQIGDNVFIISHGKDSKNLKFGFKVFLDKPQMEKIDNYIDEHFLLQPNVKIEFSKGDSHQFVFDWSSSDRFNYFNYPALSPSSSWVQVNFKKGVSGIVLFNYRDTEDYNVKPLFFEWKR